MALAVTDSRHSARHEPGDEHWRCRCGHSEPYTTALEMVDQFKTHVTEANRATWDDEQQQLPDR